MIKIKCDKCGIEVNEGSYRDITTNVVNLVPDQNGFCVSDALYRVPVHHQLCSKCSRKFDAYYDKCVAEFLAGDFLIEENL